MNDQGKIWLYAVVSSSAASSQQCPATALTGVAGEPVQLMHRAGVTAAVGAVDALAWDSDTLSRQLQDPAWLEQLARAHHQVVTQLFTQLPTVPFRLATVCHDDEGLEKLLAHCSPDLHSALELVTGRAEWGVRVHDTRPTTVEPAAVSSAAAAQRAPARPGTDYLHRRRAERAARQERKREASVIARLLHDTLATQAANGRQLPCSTTSAGPDEPALVLNASYLVDNEHTERFLQTVRDLAHAYPQLQPQVTGPWPAYSFVDIGESVT